MNKKKLYSSVSSKGAMHSVFNNRPVKVLSPEDVVPNTLMAFTFNPSFEPYSWASPSIIRYDTYHNRLIDIFKELKYSKVKLYHELSCMGKWHLHGYIIIEKPMEFTLFDLKYLKADATMEIDTIGNPEVWEKYVMKQQPLMQQLLIDQMAGIPSFISNMDGAKLLKVKVDKLRKDEELRICPEPDTDMRTIKEIMMEKYWDDFSKKASDQPDVDPDD